MDFSLKDCVFKLEERKKETYSTQKKRLVSGDNKQFSECVEITSSVSGGPVNTNKIYEAGLIGLQFAMAQWGRNY